VPISGCPSFCGSSGPGALFGRIAADPDGRRVYSGVSRNANAGIPSVSGFLEVDARSGSLMREFVRPYTVGRMAVHPFQPLLAVQVDDGTGPRLMFVSTQSFDVVAATALPSSAEPFWAPTFSLDGTHVFVSTPHAVHKLSVKSGAIVATRPIEMASSLQSHPTHPWMVGIDSDGSIVALDIDTLDVALRLPVLARDFVIGRDGDLRVFGYSDDDSEVLSVVGLTGERRNTIPAPTLYAFVKGGPSAFVYRLQWSGSDLGLVQLDPESFDVLDAWAVRLGAPLSNSRVLDRIAFLPEPALAVEYYHVSLDHYFLTADADEIDGLDRGAFAGWQRTGESFKVMRSDAVTGGAEIPVCRFYGLPSRGLDSHFYTASQAECDAVEHGYDGAWLKERADAFYVVGANGTTGACPEGTSPVYRLWNARFDSNHRYTMSAAIKAEMVARGYVPEGSGPENVAFCARS
jgi:hypothetical protein